MLIPLRLRTKLICIFASMVVIVLACGAGLFWSTRQVDSTLDRLVNKEMEAYKIAREMELALASQKGYLTYYLVDGNEEWLQSLIDFRARFRDNLAEIAKLELDTNQLEKRDRIAEVYAHYTTTKDAAIHNYQRARSPLSISDAHEKQRDDFFLLQELCKSFSETQLVRIQEAEQTAMQRSRKLRMIAWSTLFLFSSLCIAFIAMLYKQILEPIRDLAIETGSSPKDSTMDEVDSLRQSLKGMMDDFDATHDELTRSRKILLEAERMASVGELAAGVAHSIRNPFTSIKMRMYSLSRSMNFNREQREDLQVISDEITRIDKIVANFLEFARPPKLHMERCNLGELVESVRTLMKYRLKQYGTELLYEGEKEVLPLTVDADRIREALLNLITNSCEAMEAGGSIHIRETREHDGELGECGVLTITDTGPGIPEPIQHKVTTPFFSTREDGSGLGLAIVNRIVQEHGGKLVIVPCETGAEIIIKLPI